MIQVWSRQWAEQFGQYQSLNAFALPCNFHGLAVLVIACLEFTVEFPSICKVIPNYRMIRQFVLPFPGVFRMYQPKLST